MVTACWRSLGRVAALNRGLQRRKMIREGWLLLISTKSISWPGTASATQYSLIKIALIVLVCLSPLLAGCDEPAPREKPTASAPSGIDAFAFAERNWIDVKDGISPAVWLASREAGRDVAPNDPAAASFRALLEDADARFTEGPRMIANRAVQVQSMLAERGVQETPRRVIEGLVSIGQIGERAGFGETCQHYVNARASSGSRTAALEALSRQPLPPASGADER